MMNKNTHKHSSSGLLFSMLGALTMIFILSQQANAADLTVNIGDIEQGKGHVLVALFQGDENYQQGKSIKAKKVKASEKNETIVFEGLADGEYAIKMYQDENDNDKLDFNMLGIPKEGYGFSNNVGMFGAPEFNEAKFIVKDNTEIDINLF